VLFLKHALTLNNSI